MSARGHGPPPYGSRSTQTNRHGSYPMGHNIEPPHHPDPGDIKLAAQSAELETLISDNKRLAANHVALRQDLVAAQQDIQKLRAHIGSIQNESDIQIQIFLEKMEKMEIHIRAGENVKKDVQNAHSEARTLVATRQQLTDQVKRATRELEKVRADVEKLPEMHVELDGLRQEHHKLRSSFEYEKSLNMEKVAELEVMEKDLVRMASEVERLRAGVLNSENRAHAPNVYNGSYMNQELYPLPPPPPPPPPHMHASGTTYVDGYGNHHHVQMVVGGHPGPVGPSDNPQWGPPTMIPYGGPRPGPAAPGGNSQWGGPPII